MHQQRERSVRDDRGRPDDLAACALADHLPGGLLVAEKDAAKVDRHYPIPVLGRQVQKRLDLGYPRVRHQDVELTELVGDTPHHALDLPRIGDVGGYGGRTPTGLSNLLRYAVELVAVGFYVVDRNIEPVRRQTKRYPRPMPLAAPVTSATRDAAPLLSAMILLLKILRPLPSQIHAKRQDRKRYYGTPCLAGSMLGPLAYWSATYL